MRPVIHIYKPTYDPLFLYILDMLDKGKGNVLITRTLLEENKDLDTDTLKSICQYTVRRPSWRHPVVYSLTYNNLTSLTSFIHYLNTL